MDEQVKARLIGATVLVVIAVALVPELLSGPKQDVGSGAAQGGKRSRTITIDLGGAVASGARVQPATPAASPPRDVSRLPTVAAPGTTAERGESTTAPAPSTSDTVAAAAKPAATVAASEPIPPPPATIAPAMGGWSVQVGAFGSADTARKLVSDLKKDGLPAYVAPLSRNGKTLHRVRVGPEATRAEADKLAAKLKGRGLPASVVSGA